MKTLTLFGITLIRATPEERKAIEKLAADIAEKHAIGGDGYAGPKKPEVLVKIGEVPIMKREDE